MIFPCSFRSCSYVESVLNEVSCIDLINQNLLWKLAKIENFNAFVFSNLLCK